MTLTELAEKYGSDKGTKRGATDGHYYTQIYDELFAPYQRLKFPLFEIGVREGHSLNMWKEFFPHAVVYGIDISTDCSKLVDERTHIEIINQNDQKGLDMLFTRWAINPFIVIDDGSHNCSDIIASLEIVMKYLAHGGFYCIEDLDPNQGKSTVKTYIAGLLSLYTDLELVGYYPSKTGSGEELCVIKKL
jgi:hypothetical protein